MELALLKWIQSFSSPFLDGLFQLITMLGEQWAVVLALALSYWVIDKNMGEEFAFTLPVSYTHLVVTTMMGLGLMPSSHPLYLGMLGSFGCSAANYAIHPVSYTHLLLLL